MAPVIKIVPGKNLQRGFDAVARNLKAQAEALRD
jgi:hypothetical protein